MVSRAQRYARRQVAWSCGLGGKFTNEQQWRQEAQRRKFKVVEVTHPSGSGTWLVAKDLDGNRVGTYDLDQDKGELTQDPRKGFNASLSLRPLAFSFSDDLDRELFAAEVEFAFRKKPRRLETWNASCAVPVRTQQEAQYVSKVARKYQAVRASSWACGPSGVLRAAAPIAPASPANPAAGDAPAACDISVSFKTPQAAQAAAMQAMRMGCDKVAVEGSTLKVTCPHENAQQVMGAAARAMGSAAQV